MSGGGDPADKDPGLVDRLQGTLRLAARSLRYRNFRLYFTGQGISLIGTWMHRIAMSWLVYRLTGSAFMLGLVGFAGRIPTLLLAPLAGVAADRWSRKRILYTTQSASLVQAGLLAVLVLTGAVEIWHVMILVVLLGTMDAFDIPARQAFFVHMIEDEDDLGNAIALNSSVFNAARLVGPSLAGILIAMVGEGLVFALNALTYLSMITALRMIHTESSGAQDRSRKVLENLRDGFGFAWGFQPVRAVLILVTVVSLVGVPFVILMPIFATDVLGGGPDTLGFLMAAQGVGALAGALYLAVRQGIRGLGRLIAGASSLFGVGLLLFSMSRTLWLSMPLLAVAGFGLMVQMASANTFLQTIVSDAMRGRIMSLYTMAFIGSIPLGSLYAGAVAERIGAPATVLIGGIACMAAGGWFARQLPKLRPQVVKKYEAARA